MKNHKIVIAADIFSPDIGGPATYSVQLAKALVDDGWQVKLICYSDKKQEDNYPFPVYRIIRTKFKLVHYFNYWKKLKQMAKDSDVIYAMGPVGAGYPAYKVAKNLNKKLVSKVVGDYAWEQARNLNKTDLGIDDFQNASFGGKIGLLKKIESEVCKNAHKVITPSYYLKGMVEGWGAKPESVQVIYNAIEDFSSNIVPSDRREKNLIVSIGRLVPWKGFDTLIKAMPNILKNNPEMKLKIYGSGPWENNLRSLITELNLSNSVSIRRLPHQELIQELARAEMFVLNTGYEGLPHTVLEAMSLQVPVITTNLCGNPEIVQDNHSGMLIEYNNQAELEKAILKLNADSELRQRFVDTASKDMIKFKFETMIRETKKALEEL